MPFLILYLDIRRVGLNRICLRLLLLREREMYASIWSGVCREPNAAQVRAYVANRFLGTLFGEVVCIAQAKWSPSC